MVLCKYATPSRTLERCIKSLNALGQQTRLTLRWIKAHVGTISKEKADELAKAVASNSTDNVRTLDDIPAPYSFLVKKVEEGTCRLWTNHWMTEQNPDGSTRYRQSKIFFPQPKKSKSYFLIKQGKTTLFRLIQFITGHTFMRRHNYLVQGNGDEPQPPCRLCLQGEETPHHLLHYCDAIARTRMMIFGNYILHHNTEGYELKWNGGQLKTFSSFVSPNFSWMQMKTNQMTIHLHLPDPPREDGDLTRLSNKTANQ